jgi:hypothetical protein
MNVDSQLGQKFSLGHNYIAGNERNKFALLAFISEAERCRSLG